MGIFSRRDRSSSDTPDVEYEVSEESEERISESEISQMIQNAADEIGKSAEDSMELEEDAYQSRTSPAVEAAKALEQSTGSHALDRHLQGFAEMQSDITGLSDLLIRFQERNAQMRTFGEDLRAESARNMEIARQREEFQSEVSRLADLSDDQAETILRLESELDSTNKLHSGMKADLQHLQKKLHDEQEKNKRLRERDQNAASDLNAKLVRIADLEADQSRLKAEVERTRASKTEAEKTLAQAVRESSGLRSSLSQLEVKLEKAIASEKQMIAEKEHSLEDRRQLRRENAAQKGDIDELKLKVARLQSENENIAKRLASEKFSFSHERDAMKAEIGVLRNANVENDHEIAQLRSALEKAESERDRIRTELNDATRNMLRGREELSNQNRSISDLSLKYSADLLSLDQLRDENEELRARHDKLQAKYDRLADVETQFKSADDRANKLEAKLADYVRTLGDKKPKTADKAKTTPPAAEEETEREDMSTVKFTIVGEDDHEDPSSVVKH